MTTMRLSEARRLLAPLHVAPADSFFSVAPFDPTLYGPDPCAETFVATGRNGLRLLSAAVLRYIHPNILPVIVEELNGTEERGERGNEKRPGVRRPPGPSSWGARASKHKGVL